MTTRAAPARDDQSAPGAESRRSQRRNAREELSRAQFLDAAEVVFGLKGFRATTLKDIAEHAEYSPASLYSFFDNKSDLLGQIFLRRGEQMMPGLREVFRADLPALERLLLFGDFTTDFFRDRPAFARLSLRYLHVDAIIFDVGDTQDVISGNYAEVVALVQELFAEGQRAGTIRDGRPLAFARMWMGMASTFRAMDLTQRDADHELFSRDELRDLVVQAFGTSSPRAKRKPRPRPAAH